MITKSIIKRIDTISAGVKSLASPIIVNIKKLPGSDLWEVTETFKRYRDKTAYGANAVKHNTFTIKQPSDYSRYRPDYKGTVIIMSAPRSTAWNVDGSRREAVKA